MRVQLPCELAPVSGAIGSWHPPAPLQDAVGPEGPWDPGKASAGQGEHPSVPPGLPHNQDFILSKDLWGPDEKHFEQYLAHRHSQKTTRDIAEFGVEVDRCEYKWRLSQSWGNIRKPVAVVENTRLREYALKEIRPGYRLWEKG